MEMQRVFLLRSIFMAKMGLCVRKDDDDGVAAQPHAHGRADGAALRSVQVVPVLGWGEVAIRIGVGTGRILQQLGEALAQELPGCIADGVLIEIVALTSHGD